MKKNNFVIADEIIEPTTPTPKKEIIQVATSNIATKPNNIYKNNKKYLVAFDNDTQDFMTNQKWLTRKSTNQYINDLIRDDMNKRFNTTNLKDDELINKWLEIKSKNNL